MNAHRVWFLTASLCLGLVMLLALPAWSWAQTVKPLGPLMGQSSAAPAQEVVPELVAPTPSEPEPVAEEPAQAVAEPVEETPPATARPAAPKKKTAELRISVNRPFGFKKTEKQVKSKAASSTSKAKACIKDASKMKSGTVEVTVRVDIKGKVTESKAKKQTIGDAKAAQCIADSVKKLGSFPKPDSGMAGLNLTYVVTVK